MKSVATNVDISIGSYPVLLIRRAILAILLPNFLTSCLGFFHEPYFLQGLDKGVNGGRVDLLMLLDNGAKYLRTRGVIPEVFFDILPDIKRDGHKHSLSASSKIVVVKI